MKRSKMDITTKTNPDDEFLVHHRSKTVLLLVHQLEDVAPVAAMCALLGDLYRHRTLFASNSRRHHHTPMIVLRVAVVPSLRHYFVRAAGSTGGQEKIVTWRAHERSSTSFMATRWITHVGAPDSIWTLDKNNGYEKAFYGEHDDGGMADMILVGSSSSLSFRVWQNLARLVELLPSNCHNAAQPLVIATLGSLRGLDWLSRGAFAEVTTISHQQQSTDTRIQRRRPLALVGFPNLLWYCRMIPESKSNNSKKIHTKLSQENSIVLMVGRESSSATRQPVCLMLDQIYPTSLQQDAALLLLRQTLFPPTTELEINPPFELYFRSTIINDSNNSLLAAGKPPLYGFLWYLLQDHHMIQFPCYMAIYGTTDGFQRQRRTLGSLIFSVLQEVLSVLHHFYGCIQQSSIRNYDQQQRQLDESFCESITDPLQLSLLAKLLGTGGTLMEDLSNNRMAELVGRMRWSLLASQSRIHNNNNTNTNHQAALPEAALKQRWILEPLLTRAALAEWQAVMQQSPYEDATTCPTLIRQVQNDSVRCGLSLILQVGHLLKLPKEFLTNTEWVVRRALALSCNGNHEGMTLSGVPLNSWGIQTVEDLREFLLRYPPLGGAPWPHLTPVAPLRSKL